MSEGVITSKQLLSFRFLSSGEERNLVTRIRRQQQPSSRNEYNDNETLEQEGAGHSTAISSVRGIRNRVKKGNNTIRFR